MDSLLSNEEFERFRNVINRESGIHFSDTNRSILDSRLRERLRSSSLDTVGEYYDLITRDKDEFKTLLDSVTTNLTRFFRNDSHFAALEYDVIPDIIKHKRSTGSRNLRIWSAGCSTGEEAYSVAIMLAELLPPGIGFEITASDLSLKSLMIAREGFYLETRMGGVSEKFRQRFFTKRDDGFLINDSIKSHITFDYHNLKFDSGLRELDLLLCRNVIIYFDDAAKKAVVEKFWEALNDHSYLFIGHSESLFGMNTSFEFRKTDNATFYVKHRDQAG